MDRFYVYAYLRNSDGTPYYIGKGTGRRCYESHCVSIPPDRSNIVFLHENISERKALTLENQLIGEYGRKDIGTGILHNRTDGGDGGPSGRIVTEESRLKSSMSNRGQKRTEEQKRRMSEAQKALNNTGENNSFYGKKHNKSTKEAMSRAKKGKTYEEIYGKEQGAELKKKRSEKLKGRTFSEESLEKMRKPKGPQKRVKCPHCPKIGGISAMKRAHFDNCKAK